MDARHLCLFPDSALSSAVPHSAAHESADDRCTDRPGFSILDEWVLVLAPSGRDSALVSRILHQAMLKFHVCTHAQELCAKLEQGAGTVLIASEALDEETSTCLHAILGKAPAWSDLPVVILTASDQENATELTRQESLTQLGNVTFLERPIRSQTLLPAVSAALRARRRQYEVRDLLVKQQKAVERVDLLAEVATHLLLSDRPEEIVASVFGKIAEHLGLEVCLCYLLDEAGQCLRLSSHFGLPEGVLKQREWLGLHESFCGSIIREGKRVVIENVQSSSNPATAHVKVLGVTAFACFPLVANGRMMGTLSFGMRQRDRFEHEELAMMETVCNQVAVAIERKHTEEALQDLNQALENRVAERTAQLQETTEQMEAFTYSISHDLRAPLRAIRGFAQALVEDYACALDATGRDYLDRMAAGAERLDHLIQDVLQYSRLSRSTLSFQPIQLDRSVQRVLLYLDRDIRACNAMVEVRTPLPEVLGHEPTLEQVLSNLISNSLKFVAPGVRPRIVIRGESDGKNGRLWVEDNGIGIAAVHHQRIFGVFERLHNTDAYPGTGIGLAIVAKGVARMGGHFGVESEQGAGSKFWIELPQPGPGELENAETGQPAASLAGAEG